METQWMTGAFLKYENKVLLIKRSSKKKLNPGKWAPIGGHIEPSEINSPAKACLREIAEETGIEACDIINFKLRFIIVRNSGDKIFINYIFAGDLMREIELLKCDEGILHWVDYDKFPNYDISFSVKQAAALLVKSPDEHSILIGVVSSNNEQICWNAL